VLGERPVGIVADVGGPVVVGCSGGADSLAALALAVAAGVAPIAVHVDHGLRPGSALEAAPVERAAEALGAGFVARSVTVAPGSSLEARARDARYAALESVRAEHSAVAVIVGHTRDDQAETVLLNLLRGSATTGLSGMPAARARVVRPLLGVSRTQTIELCRRLGLDPFSDPMNADVRHQRVWVRRELVPFLEAGADRELRPVLARQAERLRAESDFLDGLGSQLLAAAGGAAPSLARLRQADVVVARRAVRGWLGAPPASAGVIDAVLALTPGSGAVNLPGGDRVGVRRGRLVRDQPAPATKVEREPAPVAVPGTSVAHGMRFTSWVERAAPVAWPDGRWTCVLDADVVGSGAWVRVARAGERFQPLGLTGTKPVSMVLAEAGVAPAGRTQSPIMALVDGEPLWVVGYRIGARARVTTRTRRFLWITAETLDL